MSSPSFAQLLIIAFAAGLIILINATKASSTPKVISAVVISQIAMLAYLKANGAICL